jgi:hypothetical protein
VHDLAISKLVAGREKDLDYVNALLRHQLADEEILRERLEATPLAPDRRQLCTERLWRLSGKG